MSEYKTAFTKRGGELAMAYDKSEDFKAIQADVLTIDMADNDLISNLKKLKTDNKSITKAINALNEQLGNAQVSASDAVQRVVALEDVVAQLRAQLESGDVNGGGQPVQRAEHVVGMVLAEEGGGAGTWVRVNQNFEIVDFDPEHGTWAGMKTVMNDTYGEFVEIPVTYVKSETLTDGPYAGKNCWWTADGPVDGFHVHPAFIGQDGQPHSLQIASWIASNKNNVPFSEDKVNATDYWNDISYNVIHAKGWMMGDCRPYNIYDHHLLARLMLTEFGTSDVQSQTVDGVAWTGANRVNYHGIYDPFGLPNFGLHYALDGCTTLNGTYQILAADGSLSMIETGISCPNDAVWPINCHIDKVNGIDFGDLFIANDVNTSAAQGSFADCQNVKSDHAIATAWISTNNCGPFCCGSIALTGNEFYGWRISRCI